jgi:hypothetical protein
VFAFAIVAGAAVGYALRVRGQGEAAPTTTDAAAPVAHAPPPAPAGSDAPPPQVLPHDELVAISVDTNPVGVHVIVDGEDRGVTPVDVRVKKGGVAMKVELHAAGYQPQSQDVVADKDQHLFFSMLPLPRKSGGGTGKKGPKNQGSGFHRFD